MKRFSKPLKVLTGCILVLCTLVVTVWAAPTGNCPGGCAHPAAIGSIHYDTLAEAVSASKSGDTVTLLTDVALTAPLRITTPIVLDLGGKTLRQSACRAGSGILYRGRHCTQRWDHRRCGFCTAGQRLQCNH